MRKPGLFILFSVIVLGSLTAPGQKKRSTPPKKVGQSVSVTKNVRQEPGVWKPFEFRQGNIAAKFPGDPTTEVKKESPAGAVFPERFYSYQDGENIYYSLQVTSNSYLVEDTDTLDEYYDSWIADFRRDPGLKDIQTSDVYLGAHRGRQMIAQRFGGRLRHTTRLYIIAGNVYQAQVMMRLDSPAAEIPALENSSRLFFESLRLIEPRAAVTKPIEDVFPKGYAGQLQQGNYVNTGFGFTMKAPAGWVAVPGNVLDEMKGLAYMTVDADGPTKRVKVILALSRRPFGADTNSIFTVLIEKLKFRDITLQDAAERNRSVIRRQSPEFKTKLEKDIWMETINGTKFSTLETTLEMDGKPFRQKQYMIVRNNYYFLFTNTSAADEDFEEADKAIRSINFQ
jgi:hypothetical protein